MTAADGCVSGESLSSHFGGRPWCATSIDAENNPTSRSACAPLTLIHTVAGRGGTTEETSTPVDIDSRLYRYTPSETSLPSSGPEFHLVLSSRKDRSVVAYSTPFAIECAHYRVLITLKAGEKLTIDSSLITDLSSALNFPASKITDVKEYGDKALISRD